MELKPMYKCAIGLDVHQKLITACVIAEHDSGEIVTEVNVFGGCKRDRRALAEWALQWKPDIVVMESTGIYWKSPYAAIENPGTVYLFIGKIRGQYIYLLLDTEIRGHISIYC